MRRIDGAIERRFNFKWVIKYPILMVGKHDLHLHFVSILPIVNGDVKIVSVEGCSAGEIFTIICKVPDHRFFDPFNLECPANLKSFRFTRNRSAVKFDLRKIFGIEVFSGTQVPAS